MPEDRKRVLHLYSDWRWTGPADPTIQLCRALKDGGWDVLLACRRPLEGHLQSVLSKAKEQGVPVSTDLRLNRYLAVKETVRDLLRVGQFIRSRGIGLIHCHLTHDHALGGWGSASLGRRVPVIRTNHKGVPLRSTIGNRWLLKRWTDGLIEFSTGALLNDRQNFEISGSKVVYVSPALDLGRFHPGVIQNDIRSVLGVKPQETLVGIVARMQRHRRFHVLLEAMALLKEENPAVRLMILGRGTHQETVARAPVRQMGLEYHVLFPGYRTADYVNYLGGIDIKVFLVPGSDGTCRAVREAMALGKPVVATRRGMLPEIVEHGVTGFIVDDTPEGIAKAVLELARRPELRYRMGEAARNKATREFDLNHQAVKVGAFYDAMLQKHPDTGNGR